MIERRRRQVTDAPGRRSADLAWAAGIIESEGSLRISTTLHVAVTNTDRAMLARLQAIFALGRIRVSGGTNRVAFRWDVYGQKARGILERVRPYMVTKQGQADLLLDHRTGVRSHLVRPTELERRRLARARLSYLKRHPDLDTGTPLPLPEPT